MNIAFVDLKKQYTAIQDEINAAVHNVIAESAFVGGKYVQAFEQEFAHFCNFLQHDAAPVVPAPPTVHMLDQTVDQWALATARMPSISLCGAWVSGPGMKSSRQPIRSLPPRRALP